MDDDAQGELVQATEPRPQPRVSPISGVAPPAQYRFKPGQSGNPKGSKPKDPAVARAEQILKAAVADAAGQIVALAMHADDEGIRLKASTLLVERELGKPQDQVQVSVAPAPSNDDVDAACKEFGIQPRLQLLPGDEDD